ncbi:hypothetical protein CC78DRAFT_585134 [Lojkania enalia]|uniref:Zn(2)-C6 fungal-type domain-containing protein n=1 Tax=Lojkania enalia TaxID=147567 RepID=A0A9P4JZK6_9PLEO|nr:hypothetical protein CC78DRAFT_585134 [Didymosphaeria enalia]
MVFRGKPSKACQRCRDRKLRCDLREISCGSCIRACVPCSGYRNISIIRFTDQTQEVHQKAQSKSSKHSSLNTAPSVFLRPFPLSLELEARYLFYAYYITDFSRTWDFLSPLFDPVTTPEYVSLGIDAVSLAFLFHQSHSPSALLLSRQKYVSALRKTASVLQCPTPALLETMLKASLLLDLYEKLSSPDEALKNLAHVNGALALVKLRGLPEFRDAASFKALMRLVMNLIISCVTRSAPTSPEIYAIREHAALYMDVRDPKWRLSDLSIECTNLLAETKQNVLATEEYVLRCMELEKKFEDLDAEMPGSWQYERVTVKSRSDRILEGYYDVYPNRKLTQTRNVLRQSRIIICEKIVERCQDPDSPSSYFKYQQHAKDVIGNMIMEICASVPQMTDCQFAAAHKRGSTSTGSGHSHTLSHYFDVYILLFPLYVAAWSSVCSEAARIWIVREIYHIAEHFSIREAALVGAILRDRDVQANPWDIYRLLGSYAFAA